MTPLSRIGKLFLLSLLVLVAPVVIAACGGDDGGDEDPETVLRETFENDEAVSSGTFSLSVNGAVEGGESPGNGEASLSGSFQSDPDDPSALPQLDLTGSVTGEVEGITGGGEGELTITEDNAYVTFQGETYEVGTDLFSTLQDQFAAAAAMTAGGTTGAEGSTTQSFDEQCATTLETLGADAAACDTIDVYSWFNLTNEGEVDVEGAPTTHIHGEVDVPAMLDNINAAIEAANIPDATTIPEETASQIEGAVESLTFDVYSGTEDRLLRGLDLDLTIDPSAIPEASAEGLTSITGGLSFRIGAVNEPQTIEAPTDAQPLDDLLSQYGLSTADLEAQLGAMSSLGLGGTGSTDLGGGGFGDLGGDDLGGGFGGGGGGGGGSTGDAYADCILESTSNNPFKECEDLLQ
jgi:hypothetical protein